MVFQGVGIPMGATIAASLEGAFRWRRVAMTRGPVARPADGVAVPASLAEARCMVQHQRTAGP
jgi:hypothetical protein